MDVSNGAGHCVLTPSLANQLNRIYREIGIDVPEPSNIQFWFDEELIRRSAGLPGRNPVGGWMPRLESLDYETHLKSLNINLFAQMGMLTNELSKAASKIYERWMLEASEINARESIVRDGKLINVPSDHLYYRFLKNFTGSGLTSEYEIIADKLLEKIARWEKYPETRISWSYQRPPVDENNLLGDSNNPMGHGLLFLAKNLIHNQLSSFRKLEKLYTEVNASLNLTDNQDVEKQLFNLDSGTSHSEIKEDIKAINFKRNILPILIPILF